MVSLNSSTIASNLAEGVLFGTRRGVFTEARDSDGLLVAADGGVLFLDEIVELSPEVQVKLLRVVESGEVLAMGSTTPRRVDVRFVTASHQDLRRRTAEGRFREDLFFRLNQASLTVKPLRERREEMPWLMQLDVEAEGSLPVHATAVELVLLRPWPGNLRELRAATREAHARALLEKDTAVRSKHFSEEAGRAFGVAAAPVASAPVVEVGPPVPERAWPTKDEVVAALAECGGVISKAQRLLGLAHRTQLKRLMEKYELISNDEPD
jgi:DNA-binding NtrC family response regulator